MMASQSLSTACKPSSSLLASIHARARSLRANGGMNTSTAATRVGCKNAILDSVETTASPSVRRSANYQPNSWDYRSLQLGGIDRTYLQVNATRIERLKEEILLLLYAEDELMAKLELVDALQKLCLAHHFRKEIKALLYSISMSKNRCASLAEDLHAAALLFRLLREHGFHVSQDTFDTFKDNNGNFNEYICNDPQGLLSLYEASHLAFEGEESLDKARAFTIKHMKELEPCIDLKLSAKVNRALELPLHWRIPRLDAKWHIEQYEKDGTIEPALLHLAKLDFNTIQSLHRDELKRMTSWWRELGVADRLPFARDRLVECFFFAAGIVCEPKLGDYREEMTKVCNLITTLDDAYDIYGSLDELMLFTDAVNKWEFRAIDELPNYLKTCFSALYETTNEIANKIQRKDGKNILSYLKKAWADLCNSFFVEAKWHSTGYFPTLEEYLDNGWMSVSGHVLLTHLFCLSNETGETTQFLKNYPDFFRSSSTIFRLCNDLATSEAEIARGDVPTSILCYMHEHGVTEDDARGEIKRLIDETWKKLNKEVANCSPYSEFLAASAINLAQVAHCMYQNGDGVGAPDKEKKNQIKSLFLEPIAIRRRKGFE